MSKESNNTLTAESEFMEARYNFDWKEFLILTFTWLEEVLTASFVYNIYMCTCKVELREITLKSRILTLMLTILIVFFFGGLQQLVHFAQARIFPERALHVFWLPLLADFGPLLSMLVFAAMMYMAVHVLLSLMSSARFREEQGQGRGSGFLYGLVMVLIVAQLLRFVMKISNTIIAAQMSNAVFKCVAESRAQMEEWLLVPSCITGEFDHTVNYLSAIYCGFIEHLYIAHHLISKKLLEKAQTAN